MAHCANLCAVFRPSCTFASTSLPRLNVLQPLKSPCVTLHNAFEGIPRALCRPTFIVQVRDQQLPNLVSHRVNLSERPIDGRAQIPSVVSLRFAPVDVPAM